MWQHTYPEVQDSPTGGFQINQVPIPRLRLKQLRDLARAFNIKIDLDAPKQRILPALEAAAETGVFQGKPYNEYYWMRAHRTPDDPPLTHPPMDDAIVAVEVEESPSFETITDPEIADLKWHDLLKKAKAEFPDVNLYGMKRDEIEALFQ